MARYFVFAGESYYAYGGAQDCLFKRDSLDEAKKLADSLVGSSREFSTRENPDADDIRHCEIEWAHVMDGETLKIVYLSGDERPLSPAMIGDNIIWRD